MSGIALAGVVRVLKPLYCLKVIHAWLANPRMVINAICVLASARAQGAAEKTFSGPGGAGGNPSSLGVWVSSNEGAENGLPHVINSPLGTHMRVMPVKDTNNVRGSSQGQQVTERRAILKTMPQDWQTNHSWRGREVSTMVQLRRSITNQFSNSGLTAMAMVYFASQNVC
ncbi:hypothetical protein FA15DRAFT_661818 [Coprinopsis marcescibilis]|uniref:Uncharacterized protein n=1 Tax=Coprinopsis marcescibilis TaxID=230819 RepID=A0A5C3KA23_COPMA|nr:hypothetical protein FA15DRAFT_661818 [Coprinopsis marcescibilis]